MTATSMKPTIVIPTGYEADQRRIAQKQKLADAMMSLAMQQEDGMTSWAQPLGKIAEAFVGKMLDRKSGKMQDDLNTRIKGDYTAAHTAMDEAVRTGMAPADVIRQFGDNPLLADDVKPYREAFGKALSEREGLRDWNGRLQRSGDIVDGGQVAYDPNKTVNRDGNGNLVINPIKITADLASQGYPIDPTGKNPYGIHGAVTSMPDPSFAAKPQVQAPQQVFGGPAQAPAQPAGELPPADPSQYSAVTKAMVGQRLGPNNIPSGNPLDPNLGQQRVPDGYPAPHKMLGGKGYWNINGQWYDNPEGK